MSDVRVRHQLLDLYAYVQLMGSLDPTDAGLRNPEAKAALQELADFLSTASDEELDKRSNDLRTVLTRWAEPYEARAKLKVPVARVAADFNLLCGVGADFWSFGISYGWLVERMDCANLPFPGDLPYHARIGVGHHAGFASIEEFYLLQDAFFMLVSAGDAYERMQARAGAIKKAARRVEWRVTHQQLTLGNLNVATFSRLGIVSAASFVESFVNSIGHDYTAKASGLSSDDQNVLDGMDKNGRYLSLEKKLERVPAVIRTDRTSPIVLSDKNQEREPYTSFLKEVKPVRDAAMHYAPVKEAITRRPQEWLECVRRSLEVSVAVARDFWRSCYPKREPPHYLHSLDADKFLAEAKSRLPEIGAH
jgi:hypothetical protein